MNSGKKEIEDMIIHTWQIPGLALVEINLWNDFELNLSPVDLPLEVVDDKFLIGGVKPETRRQTDGCHRFVCPSIRLGSLTQQKYA
jgi:hypothetical protein